MDVDRGRFLEGVLHALGKGGTSTYAITCRGVVLDEGVLVCKE